MAQSLRNELLDQALRLPEDERVKLARQLLESVEQFVLTPEQRVELGAAIAEIDRGTYVDGDAFLRELGIAG